MVSIRHPFRFMGLYRFHIFPFFVWPLVWVTALARINKVPAWEGVVAFYGFSEWLWSRNLTFPDLLHSTNFTLKQAKPRPLLAEKLNLGKLKGTTVQLLVGTAWASVSSSCYSEKPCCRGLNLFLLEMVTVTSGRHKNRQLLKLFFSLFNFWSCIDKQIGRFNF